LIYHKNYKDSIFNFFLIIYFIDAIDSSLPNDEKHRPDNLQIIPKLINYAKHVNSQEQFLKEWEKCGFKMDFTNCFVKLPEGYEKSYFNRTIQ
jgi:hypothetical protein